MKPSILKNYNSIKNEVKASIWVCYILAILPVFTIILDCIFKIFNVTNLSFLHLYSQYTYLLILFPIIFILVDIIAVLCGKRRLRFNFKEFILSYLEIIPLAMCFLLIITSSIVQIIQDSSLNGFTTDVSSPYHLATGFPIILLIAMCFLFGFGIKNRNIATHILFAIVICSSILCILMLIDPKCDLFFHNPSNTNWSSVFCNSNYFGLYLTISILLLAGLFCFSTKTMRWLSFVALLLHLFVLFLVNTFSSMLAVFIALITLFILQNERLKKFSFLSLLPLFAFVAISLIVQLFAQSYYSKYIGFFAEIKQLAIDIKNIFTDYNSTLADNAGTGRFKLFKESIKQILDHPLLGNGNTYTNPHSAFLQLAEIWGLPCLTLLIISFIMSTIRFFKHFKSQSSLSIITFIAIEGFLICSLFCSIMPHITPLFLMIFGVFVRYYNIDIKKNKLQKTIKTNGIIITDQNVLN